MRRNFKRHINFCVCGLMYVNTIISVQPSILKDIYWINVSIFITKSQAMLSLLTQDWALSHSIGTWPGDCGSYIG